MKDNGFQGKVLTSLQYIQKQQDGHSQLIEKLFDRFENRCENCEKRFIGLERDISKAKGIATTLGAVFGAIGGFLIKLIK